MIMTVWGWVGFGALIFLAGLQGIPQDLIEAAQIDGCTRTRRVLADPGAAAAPGHRASCSSG